jgi:transposase-like protein
MKRQQKMHRTFSSAFKREKVELIDSGKITIKELSKIYEVSKTAVYKWKRQYSKLEKTERLVVEKISEEKKNIELLGRIRDLEQIIGKKQLELDYYKAAIGVLSEEEGEDILKKFKPRQ